MRAAEPRRSAEPWDSDCQGPSTQEAVAKARGCRWSPAITFTAAASKRTPPSRERDGRARQLDALTGDRDREIHCLGVTGFVVQEFLRQRWGVLSKGPRATLSVPPCVFQLLVFARYRIQFLQYVRPLPPGCKNWTRRDGRGVSRVRHQAQSACCVESIAPQRR